MPSIPIASFLAGSLESLLFPVLLLIGLAIWYVVSRQAPLRGRSGRSLRDGRARHRRAAEHRRRARRHPRAEALMEAGAGIPLRPPRRSVPARRTSLPLLVVARLLGVALPPWRISRCPRLVTALRAAAATVSRRFGLDGEATWAAGARPAPAITELHDQSGRAVLAGVVARSHDRDDVLRLALHAGVPARGSRARRRRALAAGGRAPGARGGQREPAQDTPASDAAAAKRGASPRWRLALADGHAAAAPPGLERVPHLVGKPVDGDIPHTEALYLIDSHGYERSGYLYPFAPGFVTHDLTALAPRPRGAD